jgi:hypothetical protein
MERALERSRHTVPRINAARARAIAASWGAFLPPLGAPAAKKEGAGPLPETIPSPFLLPEHEPWNVRTPSRKERSRFSGVFGILEEDITGKYGSANHEAFCSFSFIALGKIKSSTAVRNQQARLIHQLMDKFPTSSIVGPAGDTVKFGDAVHKLVLEIQYMPALWLRFSDVHLVKEKVTIRTGSREVVTWEMHRPRDPYDHRIYVPEPEIKTVNSYQTKPETGVRVKLWPSIRLAFAAAAIWAAAHFIGPHINLGAFHCDQRHSSYSQSENSPP